MGDYETAPEALKKVYEKSHLEALKVAFPLHFLPYLKKQAETILTASQACGQTPMKANTTRAPTSNKGVASKKDGPQSGDDG